MRLAIVGSTSLAGNAQAAAIIEKVLDHFAPDVVVSGGAVGIDSMAESAATARGIECEIHLPTVLVWSAPGGYRDRNARIADGCDALVRIAASNSKTYGSGWTRDRARQRGVPCVEYIVNIESALNAEKAR